MVPFLSAALSLVAASVATALLILLPGGGRGLNPAIALAALGVGCIAAAAAFVHTRRLSRNSRDANIARKKISPWAWVMFAVFAVFAVRSFGWLVYETDTQLVVGSPNNTGDLPLHMLLARSFANGVRWWPAHPQAAAQTLRYYPGMDLFQSLFLVLGANELKALMWVGLAGSLLAPLALYRWGGAFALASFLFNGGLIGLHYLHTGLLVDYQCCSAWKNLALSIFVTQRPFLFALPAGLLLMAHWREKFFAEAPSAPPSEPPPVRSGLLPFWVEVLLYALMPTFQLFAFVFLSMLLGGWFLVYFRRTAMRRHLLGLVGAAFVPATIMLWLMTGHFSPGSPGQKMVRVVWGWMQHEQPFLSFWGREFGEWALLGPLLWLLCARDVARAGRAWLAAAPQAGDGWRPLFPPGSAAEAAAAFVLPSGVLFLITCLVTFTPVEWDNCKLIMWCYLAVLPFLWQRLVHPLRLPLRCVLCGLLFFSGAVSLAGGLTRQQLNIPLLGRAELDAVRAMVRPLPAEARFAASPDCAHPLVICGRNLAMGYADHLFSQGLDAHPLERDLNTLLSGQPGWEAAAKRLEVSYVFWGPREQKRYAGSTAPWARDQASVAAGTWGKIYALQARGTR